MSREGQVESGRARHANRAARGSAVAFGLAGIGLVLGGIASIACGVPREAYDLAPLAGPGDVARRLGEITPLLGAAVAALVSAAVVAQLAKGRVAAETAATELIVLGAAVEVCIGGSVARIGYGPDGTVLIAAVLCLSGGVALAAAGCVAALVGE